MSEIIDFDALKNCSMQINKNAVNALMYLKDFCANQRERKCNNGMCILYTWCKGTENRLEYPRNWDIKG